MKKFMFLGIILVFFFGCASKKDLSHTSSEFRYKNTKNHSIFLPKNASFCVYDKSKKLPKVSKEIENFIKTNWKVKYTCQKPDFYIKPKYSYTRFYKYYGRDEYYDKYFASFKITITERKTHKNVADYTVFYISDWKKEVQKKDEELLEPLKKFLPIFFDKKRMFGN